MTLVLAALAIVAVTLAVGLGLRRWTAAFPTLRRQLLVITTTGVVVAALAAWLLARLMILDEDQLGPVLAVLALAAVIAGVLVAVATSALGRTARELARTVGRIEAGAGQVAVYKVGMSWPLEPEGVRAFALGLDDILVVEEKRAFVEDQVVKALYNLPGKRPTVVGKSDEQGQALWPWQAGYGQPASHPAIH